MEREPVRERRSCSTPGFRPLAITGRVLVVGDNDLAALAIVRSLGRAGLIVDLSSFEATPVTRWSRYVRRVYRHGHPLVETRQFLERLAADVRQVGYDMVLPSSDKALVPLMNVRDELGEMTCLIVPDQAGFEVTFLKDRTLALAERVGFRVPETVVLDRPEEMPDWTVSDSEPLVLKPQSSTSLGSLARNEVRIVRSRSELEKSLEDILGRCPVLCQRFCPGRGAGLSILANRGELVAAFQHERVHEPPDGGAGSYRKSVPLDENLLEGARRFCQEVSWTGPAMFEFKISQGGEPAVLMEVNGRFWGSLALAIQAGVDFPKLLYETVVLGKPREQFTYRHPVYVRHTLRDAKWFLKNLRPSGRRRELLKDSLRNLPRKLGNVLRLREGYDIESVRDPLPGVVGWSSLGRGLAAAAFRRLTPRPARKPACEVLHERTN